MDFLESELSEGKQQKRENHKQSVVVFRGKLLKAIILASCGCSMIVFIGFRYLMNGFSRRRVQKGNF